MADTDKDSDVGAEAVLINPEDRVNSEELCAKMSDSEIFEKGAAVGSGVNADHDAMFICFDYIRLRRRLKETVEDNSRLRRELDDADLHGENAAESARLSDGELANLRALHEQDEATIAILQRDGALRDEGMKEVVEERDSLANENEAMSSAFSEICTLANEATAENFKDKAKAIIAKAAEYL